MTTPSTPSSPVIDLISSRSSARDYSTRPVSADTLNIVLETARQAPTSSNVQTYSLVVVCDAEKRKALSIIAGGSRHVEVAPVLVAVCADLHRLGQICESKGSVLDADLCELNLIAVIDAALVAMCASIAAESLGLGTVMIGALRNDPAEVSRILELPKRVVCPFGLCIGWPRSRHPPKPRLPAEAVVFHEAYRPQIPEAEIEQYDKMLSAYHREIGSFSDQNWSARLATQFGNPHRANLGEVLERLGFPFR